MVEYAFPNRARPNVNGKVVTGDDNWQKLQKRYKMVENPEKMVEVLKMVLKWFSNGSQMVENQKN